MDFDRDGGRRLSDNFCLMLDLRAGRPRDSLRGSASCMPACEWRSWVTVKVALDAVECKELAFRRPIPGTPTGLDFVRGGIKGLGTEGTEFGIAM